MNGEGSVSAPRALDGLDRRKGDKRMADTRYHVSVCRIYKVTNNGGGGGQVLAAIGNMFRNAAGSQAGHKRNWKSPLVEKEAGGGGGTGRARPGGSCPCLPISQSAAGRLTAVPPGKFSQLRTHSHRFETLVSILSGDVVRNMQCEN